MSAARGPVIVVGLGRVGFRAVDLLRRLGEEVVAITLPAGAERVREAEALGARVVLTDARDERFLLDAGLAHARGLLAITDRDVVNLEIAFDAKRLRPDLPVVVRLFDQNLGRQLEAGFDVRRALAVSALAAPAFAAAALGSDALGAFEAGGRRFVVEERPAGEALAGRTPEQAETGSGARLLARDGEGPLSAGERVVIVRPADAPAAGAPALSRREPWPRRLAGAARFVGAAFRNAPRPLRTVFGVLLALIGASVFVFSAAMKLSFVDALYFLVATVTTTGYGDITPLHAGAALELYAVFVMLLGSATMATLFSIVTDFVVGERFRTMMGRPGADLGDHVVVVGLGNVGFRTAAELQRAGAVVVGVDRAVDAQLAGSLPRGIAHVLGDGRARATLVEAGVPRAAAVVAVTGDDATNLGVALLARELNPGVRTVARLYDPEFASKAEASLRLGRALGASRVAVPAFVASVLEPGVRDAFLARRELLVVVARAAPEWEGRTPRELAGEGVTLLGHLSPEGGLAPLAAREPLPRGATALAVVRRPLARA